ncbi:biotin-dependent carboxyltransferase family protein [Segetibacter sp. 3557_3]|uniref:5-oxoprolinase subunit C family protein n=1 Tax=Segetibacter sp. 3557_3 TaxID=2547429 RepID=UPI0010586B44|nr:biotin-dependent carboxyltransferase family protein [Segetibacter sp. 3557_3]TDH25265.1 biotin-dependent carboxyltransferase family protein [Segetibacter sp. 3557_3]
MSLRIIRKGLLDTIQDGGRFGFQHLGINPGGVSDPVAHYVANALVGNVAGEPVLEMHYPAPQIQFLTDCMIAISGANFTPLLNDTDVENDCTILIKAGSILRFAGQVWGVCACLAVRGGFAVKPWLASKSTNLKAGAGGFAGRALLTGDVLPFANSLPNHLGGKSGAGSWRANVSALYNRGNIRCVAGAEYDLLTPAARQNLDRGSFAITGRSDRMGYQLEGPPLSVQVDTSLISTGVTGGTIQLLPNGRLIVLMADHQTTGGYPRIAHVIRADLPSLAQKRAGEAVQFEFVDIATAEQALLIQHRHLLQLKNACNFRLAAAFGN